MARRLNTRKLALMLTFIGVPAILLVLAARGCLFSAGDPEPYFEAAKKYVEAKDWTKAWDSANLAARYGSRDPEIQFLLAKVAMHQNPPAVGRAISALRSTVNLKPDQVEAQRMLTELYLAMKWWKEARVECERLIKMAPTDGVGYLWAAAIDIGTAGSEPNESRRAPYYEAAIAHCQEGIEKAPDKLELYRLMSAAYGRLDQNDKVDDVLDLAVSNNPTLADAYILKAGRLIQQQKLEEADVLLRGALEKVPQTPEKVPENARLYVALGEVALARRNIDRARECFSKAIELDPKNEASYLRLADMLRADGKRQEAQEKLAQGLVQLPGSTLLKAEQADLLLDLHQMEEADKIIEDLHKTAAPDTAVVNYLLGKRALMLGQLRPAITYLEQARDRQPTPQTSLLLAQAYMSADELGAAQRELDVLTSEIPALSSAWRMLAEVSLRLRDLDKAARCAGRALDANPDDIAMRLLVAQTLAMKGHPADALREAQIAADRANDNPDPLLLISDILQEQNEMAKAEAALQQALAVSKNSGRVYQRLLRFYTDTRQTEKVKTLLEKAKQALPDDQYIVVLEDNPKTLEDELLRRASLPDATVANMMALARFYQLTERAEPAKEWLRKAMTKAAAGSSEWRQAWQQTFLLDLATDDSFKSAAELVAELKKTDPAAEELLFAEAILAMSKGELEPAATSLRDLIKSKQGRTMSQAYYLLGQVLVRQGKFDEAAAELGRALDLRPQLTPARLLRGRIFLRQGDLNGALREANEALKYDPHLVPAMDLRATASAGLGRYADAVASREDIRRLVPDNVSNLASLASLYIESRRSDKAEDVYKSAYALAPNSIVLVRAVAGFYADNGRAPEGEKLLDEYISKHGGEPAAWIIRGELASKIGKSAEAEKYYRKALELDPKNPAPLVFLADDYARAGDWNTAARIYQEAIKVAPDSLEAKRHLADVFMLQDRLSDAQQMIEAVLKVKPNDVSALVVAARIASRERKPAEARRLMEEALKIEPGYGEAKVRLAELYAAPDPEKASEMLRAVDPSDQAFEKAMLILSDIDARRGLLPEAIMDLRRLLDYRPVSRAGRLSLASKYMANRDHAKAVEILQDLLKQTQYQDAGLLVMLADEQLRMNNLKDALSNYQKARLLKPDSPEALIGECRCLVGLDQVHEAEQQAYHALEDPANKGAVWPRLALAAIYEKTRPEQAMDAIRNGLLQKEDWEAGYVYLADMLMRANRPDQARQALQLGLQKTPDSIAIRTGIATIEIATQHPEAAKAILEPLVKQFANLYGTNPEALGPEELDRLRPYMTPIRIYSLALYNMGQIDESLTWGMKLWVVDPTDIANANNMAWILATYKKNYPAAIDMIERYKRLVPNQPQVLDTAGWIYFLAGKYREASEDLQASIKNGDNAEAHYHLGRLHEAREQPEDARTEYQKAIQMGLSGKDAEDAEARAIKLKKP